LDEEEAYRLAVEKVVASAGKTMVLFSGGSKLGDEDLLQKAQICVASGATGLIFGRNMWQRPFEEGLAITQKVQEILRAI
jgi:class I fructose-bisphosphate aldolase